MIGVIGAGIAGLTAAHELRSRGNEVRVFESSPRVGGDLATIDLSAAPHVPGRPPAMTSEGPVQSLASSLDIDLRTRPVRSGYYLDGVVHPVDRRHELLAFPRLSLRDKSYFRSLVHDGGLSPFTLSEEALGDPTQVTGGSARSFVIEHTTESLYEQAVEPVLRAYFGEAADRISAAWLLAWVAQQDVGAETVEFPRSLVDALVESVDPENIHTNTRVTALGTRRGTVDHLVAVEDGQRRQHDVEAVVLDTPPRRLSRLTEYDWTGETSTTAIGCFGLDEPLLSIDRLTVVDETPFGRLVALPPPDTGDGVEQVLYALGRSDDPTAETVEMQFRQGIESLFPSFDTETTGWSALDTTIDPLPSVGYTDHVVPHEGVGPAGCFYAGTASLERYPDRSLDGAVRTGHVIGEIVAERSR